VSIIIPTDKPSCYLPKLVETVLDQTTQPKEIVIVNSSLDDISGSLNRDLPITFIHIPPGSFDHGGARNLGARQSKGQILVFLTHDASPASKDWLDLLIEPFRVDEGIAAVYGRQLPRRGASPLEVFAQSFNYGDEPIIKGKADIPRLGIKAFFFSNVCSAIKRSAFEDVGGFPEPIIMNEDMALAAKLIMANHKIAYAPRAAVIHSHAYSLQQQFSRYFDIGVFFSGNRWMHSVAPTHGEGWSFLKGQLRFLISSGEWRLIPYALIEGISKYAGLHLGLVARPFPRVLKRRMSFHKQFWLQEACGFKSKK
jgi:rhamnosyltransferase